jgi:hypothetical protein
MTVGTSHRPLNPVPKKYTAGFEIQRPGGASLKLGHSNSQSPINSNVCARPAKAGFLKRNGLRLRIRAR